jgi:hypothetical protein
VAFRVIRPDELEWVEREPEPGGVPAPRLGVERRPWFEHTRGSMWRYPPGAKGRRHLDTIQEETFVVLSGTLTMYLEIHRSASTSRPGDSCTWSPGTYCSQRTMATKRFSCTRTAHRRKPVAPSSSTRRSEPLREFQLRVRAAHPDLAAAVAFYELLELPVIASFEDHVGYSGVVFGLPDSSGQLELVSPKTTCPRRRPKTSSSSLSRVAPSGSKRSGSPALGRLRARRGSNPYWQRSGAVRFLDPDGYSLVLSRPRSGDPVSQSRQRPEGSMAEVLALPPRAGADARRQGLRRRASGCRAHRSYAGLSTTGRPLTRLTTELRTRGSSVRHASGQRRRRGRRLARGARLRRFSLGGCRRRSWPRRGRVPAARCVSRGAAALRVRRLLARGRAAPDPLHGGRSVGRGDLPAAREIADTVDGAELFLYRATATCSPTTAWPTTTRAPRRCSNSACSICSPGSGSPRQELSQPLCMS